MDNIFKCEGDRCIRPACCRYNNLRNLCYLHAACERKGELTFFDMGTAKKQATELKHVASHVWDDLVDELDETAERLNKTSKTPSAKATKADATPLNSQHGRSPIQGRTNIWDQAREPGVTLNSNQTTGDHFSMLSESSCPNCQSHGHVRYQVISSAIQASKADTWGSSSRPDRVLRYTCEDCGHTWLIEEG